MSQIFRRSANAIAHFSLVGAGLVVASLGFVILLLMRSDYVTGANAHITQPIQFSHMHHAGGMGIDCRYCHTSVETSSFAGIPPTKTCMNCHSQIWSTAAILEPVRASFRDDRPLRWIRVHDLPDFVYFNHSIHVQKGIGCATCHGEVQKMPLMWRAESLQMKWCLDCHRNPEKYVRPRDEVFNMTWTPPEDDPHFGQKLVEEYGIEKLTNCWTCHR